LRRHWKNIRESDLECTFQSLRVWIPERELEKGIRGAYTKPVLDRWRSPSSRRPQQPSPGAAAAGYKGVYGRGSQLRLSGWGSPVVIFKTPHCDGDLLSRISAMNVNWSASEFFHLSLPNPPRAGKPGQGKSSMPRFCFIHNGLKHLVRVAQRTHGESSSQDIESVQRKNTTSRPIITPASKYI